jgi:hypothetical protein
LGSAVPGRLWWWWRRRKKQTIDDFVSNFSCQLDSCSSLLFLLLLEAIIADLMAKKHCPSFDWTLALKKRSFPKKSLHVEQDTWIEMQKSTSFFFSYKIFKST